jgi:hypothetical protein
MSAELKIMDFAVILRNIVDLGKPQVRFTSDSVTAAFKNVIDIIAPESEWFTVTNEVAERVCSLARHDMIRFELPPLQVLDQHAKKIYFFPEDKIVEAFSGAPLLEARLFLTLHRSGVLLVNIHLHFQDTAGIALQDAIENARSNLRTVAIKLPACLYYKPTQQAKSGSKEEEAKEERCRLFQHKDGNFLVGTFKDLVSELIRPLLISRLKNAFGLEPLRDFRCVSSTLIQVYQTNPACETLDDFLLPKAYGRELHGLGSLDKQYLNRSEQALTEAFSNDLADDEEAGVFTFGLSDLIVFDHTFEKMIENTHRQKKLQDRYSAVLYHTVHYSCLLEWVYLEKYLIDLYNRMLSRTIAQKNTSPEAMLVIQKQTMHDLIGYKAGITPFPSREDFWEKARVAHRIPEAMEKFEKKRDLATDYVIQEYTLRTNKSLQLINFFISATAAFSLMQVLVNIWQGNHGKSNWFWVGLTAATFVGMLVLLWGMNKIFLKWGSRHKSDRKEKRA